jgi:hypothetical protein
MSFERFQRDKLLKRQRPDFKQISHQLERSLKDLKSAERVVLNHTTTFPYHRQSKTIFLLIISLINVKYIIAINNL